MARPNSFTRLPRLRPAHLLPAALLAVLSAGCASRFTVETNYVAPGFTIEALRGKTVAVLPLAETASPATAPVAAPTSAPAAAPAPSPAESRAPSADAGGEFAGVAGGLREAGARVRVLSPAEADRVAARPASVAAAYVLVVRVTGSGVYYASAPRHVGRGGEFLSRTTGRRVGLRLALLRARDARPVWVAAGTGEAWETRGGRGDADAGSIAGDFALYPPAPAPDWISRRLTRRLIAHLPYATELEPN